VAQITTAWTKLRDELDAAGPRIAGWTCVDDWSVKDLLAVRVWWTESVLDWVEEGRRGGTPAPPGPGYTWRETPRLNADIVRKARRQSYASLRERLRRGVERALALIDALDDRELLDPGVFAWAGRYPIARWLSINTARQYVTARAFIRAALREG